MTAPKAIHIDEYDYALPPERIAKYPLAERDHSKLLHFRHGTIHEHTFADLPNLIAPGSLLLFNDTKVIHARLLFHKSTGATIEIFCLEPWESVASVAFAEHEHCSWLCLIGNNKKWKDGTLSMDITIGNDTSTLTAQRREAQGESWIVDFSWTGGNSFAEVIEAAGVIPLPPYLHRDAESSDNERYQTVYAAHEGSVAAPTAGLHFTDSVLSALRQHNIDTEYITLQVGAGTFKPVTTATIGEHTMHVEQIQVSASNLRAVIDHAGKPIISVGTTTVRTLESIYWFGIQLGNDPHLDRMHIGQWDCYRLAEHAVPMSKAYSRVLQWMNEHDIEHLDGATQLMIAPGYQYRVVSSLVTNFHQPKSTLLLLVSALIGDNWHRCYDYALANGFRFLSYGDSCFFEP